ncbi:MAG: veratrol--corrinoid protein metyltransferase, partial [Oscillospiraceae bacterium]|nr:veratrol--corrinoid protein metyltransferase [Oscillospiraceae bacterium]
ENMVKKDVEKTGIDRTQSALTLRTHIGYFQMLMSFMGFENGLMSLYEEPEEVKELLEYMCDFYEEVLSNCIDLYKPDILNITDDTAAWNNPFISLEMYREFFLPCYDRMAKFGRDRGLPITFHNCGKCECFVDDMVAIGVRGWDPAQTCNDLVSIKRRHQGQLAIMGGWDGIGHLLSPEVTDDEIRQSVMDTMDNLAVGGGFIWCGGFMGASFDDPVVAHKNKILHETVAEYGKKFC